MGAGDSMAAMGGPPWHLVVVPHTHWDREWYRTHEQFRYRLVALLDALLDGLEADAAFRHFLLDGQTILLEDYFEVRPQARERVAKLAREGRLAVGPWHVLPDQWLVSGEALIRNLREGRRRASALGGGLPVAYVPDPFGHVGQLPQLLAGFGLEGAVLWRGVGENVATTLFAWEAPDGTRLPTVYLPCGYAHGGDLPEEPQALAERLRQEIEALAPFSRLPTLLILNGADHAVPCLGLPAALEAALALLPETTGEIGSLADFLRRARSEAGPDLPVHRGELRSALRAPLLPGCASARAPQKRSEFRNDRLLVRWLEPLAAWLAALGGDAGPAWIEFAWGLALENHPHDSVCGCSIDPVHDGMDVRYRRVEEIATAHLERVGTELAGRLAPPPRRSGDGAAFTVWNPNAGGLVLVEALLALDLPETGSTRGLPEFHLRDARGRAIAVHAESAEAGETLARGILPRAWVRRLVASTRGEISGHPVTGIDLAGGPEQPELVIRVGPAPVAGFDATAARSAVDAQLAGASVSRVAFRIERPARVRLRFVDELPSHGLRAYRVAPGAAAPHDPVRARRDRSGSVSLENESWRVEVSRSGRVTLVARRLERRIPDALRLVSEGDRGDTYNFDPVPDAVCVERPGRVRVGLLWESPVEGCIFIDAHYRVPEALAASRRARSRRRRIVPARLELRLAAGLDRLEVRVRVENTVRDHRLRLHARAPFAAQRLRVESAFEIVERPIAPPPDAFGPGLPAERPVGSGPQRRFASLDDGRLAFTVANRGVAEVEARPESDGSTSLALTLLRAVGWLSRDDLTLRPNPAGPPLAVPGAQVPGIHEAEFSLRLHRLDDPRHVVEALAFADPALALAGAGSSEAPLRDGARLVEVDDPAVVVSAVEPRPDGGIALRVCNLSEQARRVGVRWGASLPGGLEAVGLDDRPDPRVAVAPHAVGGVWLTLHPWQIVTLRRTP